MSRFLRAGLNKGPQRKPVASGFDASPLSAPAKASPRPLKHAIPRRKARTRPAMKGMPFNG